MCCLLNYNRQEAAELQLPGLVVSSQNNGYWLCLQDVHGWQWLACCIFASMWVRLQATAERHCKASPLQQGGGSC
jgi:hypothetical protein